MAQYLDVSRVYLYWRGAPRGIPRSAAGLAEAALRQGARPAVFHPLRRCWYALDDVRGLSGVVPRRGRLGRLAVRVRKRLRRLALRWLQGIRARCAAEPAWLARARALADLLDADTARRLRDLVSLGSEVVPGPGDQFLLIDTNLTAIPGYAAALWSVKARHSGLRVVALIHDVLPVTDPGHCDPGFAAEFMIWLRYLSRTADRVVTNSEAVATQVRTLLPGLPVDPVRFGSRVDAPPVLRSRRLADIVAARPARPLPAWARTARDGPWILTVGAVEFRKNHACQLDAFEPLWAAGLLASPLVVAGRDGGAAGSLRRRIAASEVLSRHVVLLGEVPDELLWDLYRGAEFTVLSSSGEGFGLPISESLQFGTPCLAADAGGTREVAGDLVSYFDPARPAELRRLATRLLTDPEFAAATAARTRAFRPHRWDDTLSDMAGGAAVPDRGQPGNSPGRTAPVPVDAVYTWCDADDPGFFAGLPAGPREAAGHAEPARAERFRSHDELKYSLRSLERFAPWVRTVHIVTNGQKPPWLRADHPRIQLVTHAEIFENPGFLPTFNSFAIEANLHRIPGLADYFVYFNDDMFIGAALPLDAYFSAGQPVFGVDDHPLPRPGFSVERVRGMLRGQEDLFRRILRHNRRLLDRRFGGGLDARVPSHVPQLYLRPALARLLEEWQPEVQRTRGHSFRGPGDFYPAAMFASWASSAARGGERYTLRTLINGSDEYRLITMRDATAPMLTAQLDDLLRARPTFFCINDAVQDPALAAYCGAALRDFLERYFPAPSTFETAGPGEQPAPDRGAGLHRETQGWKR